MSSIIEKISCKLFLSHGTTHPHSYSYSVQRGYGFQVFMRSSTNADVSTLHHYWGVFLSRNYCRAWCDKKVGVTNLILYDKSLWKMKTSTLEQHIVMVKKMYLLNNSLKIRNIVIHLNICITDTNSSIDIAFFGWKRNEKLE